MEKFDYLIVGQGIAGSILAHELLSRNKKILIVDQGSGHTSSRQATGLINPITGRRFVKSWMIDTLLPFAQAYYTKLSQDLKIDFYQETKVVKILQNLEQVNDCSARQNDENYHGYLKKNVANLSDTIIEEFTNAVIEPVIQINISFMLDGFLDEFKKRSTIIDQIFEFQDLEIQENGYRYKTFLADKIVFAEGFQLRENPFFNYLPIRFAKGEALIIKSHDLKLQAVLSSKTTLTPLKNDLYYVGASYDWNDSEQKATLAKRAYLIENLEKSITANFEIIEQKVGIRPTVTDRRPLIGEHPEHKGMYVFNGMGTKGLSLAPYFAHELIMHIEEEGTLHPEVDIRRVL